MKREGKNKKKMKQWSKRAGKSIQWNVCLVCFVCLMSIRKGYKVWNTVSKINTGDIRLYMSGPLHSLTKDTIKTSSTTPTKQRLV